MNEVVYLATRFAVRTGRIVGGIVIVSIALWLIGDGWQKVSTPFASSSLVSLVGGLFELWLGAMGCVWAYAAAFGAAPARPAAHDADAKRGRSKEVSHSSR